MLLRWRSNGYDAAARRAIADARGARHARCRRIAHMLPLRAALLSPALSGDLPH